MARQLVRLLIALSAIASAIAQAADGTLLVANRSGGSVSLIDLPTGTEVARLPIGPVIPHEMASSPDGEEIWVANRKAETLSVVSAQTLQVVASIAGPAVNRVEFRPNGQVVIPGGASADEAGRVLTYYDAEPRAVARQLELQAGGAAGTGVRLLAADGLPYLADSARDEIAVLDPAIGNPPERVSVSTDNPGGMAWSPLRVREPRQ